MFFAVFFSSCDGKTCSVSAVFLLSILNMRNYVASLIFTAFYNDGTSYLNSAIFLPSLFNMANFASYLLHICCYNVIANNVRFLLHFYCHISKQCYEKLSLLRKQCNKICCKIMIKFSNILFFYLGMYMCIHTHT